MMIRKFSRPQYLKEEWNNIYSKGINLTAFQNYDTAVMFHSAFHFEKSRIFLKDVYYYAESDNDRMILPLAEDTLHKKLYTNTYFSSLDYYDVITDSTNMSFVKDVLEQIFSNYKGYTFFYKYVNQNSTLCNLFKNPEAKEICVKINLHGKTYDNYYSGLSKHQRQNIRTAYNKLRKNNISFHLEKYCQKHPIDSNAYEQCMKMYEDRCYGKNHPKLSAIRNIVHRRGNIVYRMVKDETESLIYVLFFGNEPVAWMGGALNLARTTYYIPRLSTNNEWLSYSTGIILVNETIKDLINNGVSTMDLTRGNEPYKYAMGGEEHYNYGGSFLIDNFLNKI